MRGTNSLIQWGAPIVVSSGFLNLTFWTRRGRGGIVDGETDQDKKREECTNQQAKQRRRGSWNSTLKRFMGCRRSRVGGL